MNDKIEILHRRIAILENQLALAEQGRTPRAEDDAGDASSHPEHGSALGASLVEQETLLASAERTARMGTWIWDLSSNQVSWSRELFDILGYNPSLDTPGVEAFFARVYPGDAARVREQSVRTAITGEATPIECRLLLPSGAVRDVVLDGIATRWESGKPGRIVGTVLDVTERKTLEAQLRQSQKMEALGRLAGGVAHDFNNLLTVIQGYTQLLLHESPREELEQIALASGAAADLTRRLLAFSRQAVLEPVALDINTAVEGAVKLISRVIGEDIRVSLELAEDAWRIRADPSQMHQVLLNLTLNARDAMPDGGTLVIRTSNVILGSPPSSCDSVEHVLLSVSDTGIGMSEETKARVFEPFFTTKEPGKGTGLGLATVFAIVHRSHGTIHVTSSPGEGTTFNLYFPKTLERPVDSTRRSVTLPPGGSEGILIVEDDPAVRRLLTRVLEEAGYRVLSARLPSEARSLWKAEQRKISLLITDVVMPEQSGRDLARELREASSGDLRVLYITGYAPTAPAWQKWQDGQDAPLDAPYLPKPFTPDHLLSKVRRALRR